LVIEISLYYDARSEKHQFKMFEDGTDRGFRNVGKSQSDAGEIPKRIHKINLTSVERLHTSLYMHSIRCENLPAVNIEFTGSFDLDTYIFLVM
jgi:hypothetical protein